MFLYFFAQEVKRVAAKKMLQSPDCERATKISEHAHFLRVALFNNYRVVAPEEEENNNKSEKKEGEDKNDKMQAEEMVTNEANSWICYTSVCTVCCCDRSLVSAGSVPNV